MSGRNKQRSPMTRIGTLAGAFCAAAMLAGGSAVAASPAYAPNPAILAAAKKEGRVVVYSVLSTDAAKPLIADFESLHPDIKVDYDGESGSSETDERFRAEMGAGKPTADVMWSSAMDLQMKLARDGYAATYRSPHAAKLPGQSIYKYQVYGTTLEPVVFTYNKTLVTGADVPRDHASFARIISEQAERFNGKVATFDVEKSGVGFMFAIQDRSQSPVSKSVLAGFGCVNYRPGAGTGAMFRKISSGEYLLGYHMMGAYALSRGRKDLPGLGVVFPSDYTMALTRVMLINKKAARPNAARLWLDYVLSPRGQAVLGNALELFPIRPDVDAKYTAAKLAREIGPALRPIKLSMKLIDDLTPARHQAFLAYWNASIAAGRQRPGCPAE